MQQFRIQGFKNPKSSSETNFRSVIVSLCHTVKNIKKKKYPLDRRRSSLWSSRTRWIEFHEKFLQPRLTPIRFGQRGLTIEFSKSRSNPRLAAPIRRKRGRKRDNRRKSDWLSRGLNAGGPSTRARLEINETAVEPGSREIRSTK